MNIYIIGEAEGQKRRGIRKIVVDERKKQIIITACITKHRVSGINEELLVSNFHTTRHIDSIHNRIYFNGKPVRSAHHRFERPNLESLQEYEIIQCAEVSPSLLNSPAYKEYPNHKKNEFIVKNFNQNITIYSFVGPRRSILSLSEKLENYKIIDCAIYQFDKYDLLIAIQQNFFTTHDCLTCKLEMHIKTSKTQGIGNFIPYSPHL